MKSGNISASRGLSTNQVKQVSLNYVLRPLRQPTQPKCNQTGKAQAQADSSERAWTKRRKPRRSDNRRIFKNRSGALAAAAAPTSMRQVTTVIVLVDL